MGHLEGASRDQSVLVPAVRDADVTAANPVRGLDAVVEGLDREALGCQRAQPAAIGRPASRPGD